MKRTLTRRRFLRMSAALAVLPAAVRAGARAIEWRGTALGAGASLKLVGVGQDAAHEIFRSVEAELARLEDIFSLFRAHSALSRLNRVGRLKTPPPEMLELLALAGSVHRSTGGKFDPTVQPLWELYAKSMGAPAAADLDRARERMGWKNVIIASDVIRFSKPGMALTLNGIAQGFVTDRIVELLRRHGLTDLLVDMGEIAGLGRRADGKSWRAGISTPDGRLVQRVTLGERALATSAPLGTVLDRSGTVGHILDPLTGAPVTIHELVSVTADRAVLADALSTAFCGMGRAEIDLALRGHPSAELACLV